MSVRASRACICSGCSSDKRSSLSAISCSFSSAFDMMASPGVCLRGTSPRIVVLWCYIKAHLEGMRLDPSLMTKNSLLMFN